MPPKPQTFLRGAKKCRTEVQSFVVAITLGCPSFLAFQSLQGSPWTGGSGRPHLSNRCGLVLRLAKVVALHMPARCAKLPQMVSNIASILANRSSLYWASEVW